MKLAYDVYEPDVGSSNLSPIILHHGILETRKTWKNLGKPLAQNTGRSVYAIDARHHGESPWTGDYNYDMMVEDLEEFLVDHKIPKTILIGHSMGGRVAMSFVFKQPEEVELLIIEDVPARTFKHRLSNLVPVAVSLAREMFGNLKQMEGREEADKYIREMATVFKKQLLATPDIISSYDLEQLPIKWNGKHYVVQVNLEVIADALNTNKLQQDLSGKFDGSVLFICGGASQFKVYQDGLIEELFPRAVKVKFEGAGHFIHETLPRQFLEEVSHFINSCSGLKSKY